MKVMLSKICYPNGNHVHQILNNQVTWFSCSSLWLSFVWVKFIGTKRDSKGPLKIEGMFWTPLEQSDSGSSLTLELEMNWFKSH